MNRNDCRIAQTVLLIAALAAIGLWLTGGEQQTAVIDQQTKDSLQQQRSTDGKGTCQHYKTSSLTVGEVPIRHTEEFYRFYRAKMLFPDAQPNAAHLALAKLEKKG